MAASPFAWVSPKLADLVILDRNPPKADPMTIKDIKVLETIKEGKTYHRTMNIQVSEYMIVPWDAHA